MKKLVISEEQYHKVLGLLEEESGIGEESAFAQAVSNIAREADMIVTGVDDDEMTATIASEYIVAKLCMYDGARIGASSFKIMFDGCDDYSYEEVKDEVLRLVDILKDRGKTEIG